LKEYYTTIDGQFIILLDPIPLDSLHEPDSSILKYIERWVVRNDTIRVRLAGVIYMHDITRTRFPSSAVKVVQSFERLFRKSTPIKTILVVSKWEQLDDKTREERLARLARDTTQWGAMVLKGSSVYPFTLTAPDGHQILRTILGESHRTILDVQQQLVDSRMNLSETEAGKAVAEENRKLRSLHQDEMLSLKFEMKHALTLKDQILSESISNHESELEKRAIDYENQLLGLRAQKDEQMEMLQSRHKSEMDRMQHEVTALVREVTALRREVHQQESNLETRITDYENQLLGLKAQKDEQMEMLQSRHKNEIDRMQHEVHQRESNLETCITDNENQLLGLKAQKDEQMKILQSRHKSEMDRMQHEVTALEREVHQQKSKLETLVMDHDNQLSELESQNDAMSKIHIDELTRLKETMENRIRLLEEQNAAPPPASTGGQLESVAEIQTGALNIDQAIKTASTLKLIAHILSRLFSFSQDVLMRFREAGQKLLRPWLRPGYRRLEWRCVRYFPDQFPLMS
jgi:hypothetical protein